MARTRTFRIALARITLEGLFDGDERVFREALAESWVPGAQVTRYRRTWLLSGSEELPDGQLAGRIGFEREGGMKTLEWDDEAKDFKQGEAPTGVLVPFIVDPSRRLVSYQLVSGEVKAGSFTGALAGALNAAVEGTYEWSVTPLVQRLDYEPWRREVDVVTSFKFRLERPNPHYEDRDDVERLIENLKLETATVAGKGQSIDTEDRQFQEFLDHVRHEYGRGVIKGRSRDGETHTWLSDRGGSTPAVVQVEGVTEQADEVTEEQLAHALEDADDLAEAERNDDEEADEYEA